MSGCVPGFHRRASSLLDKDLFMADAGRKGSKRGRNWSNHFCIGFPNMAMPESFSC